MNALMHRFTVVIVFLPGCAAGGSSEQSVSFPIEKIAIHGAELDFAEGLIERTHQRTGERFFLYPNAEVTAADIAEAKLRIPNEDDPDPVCLVIKFTSAGGQKMQQLTQQRYGKPLAVLIDGKLRAAPVIHNTISDTAIISGAFTKEEAEQLREDAK